MIQLRWKLVERRTPHSVMIEDPDKYLNAYCFAILQYREGEAGYINSDGVRHPTIIFRSKEDEQWKDVEVLS